MLVLGILAIVFAAAALATAVWAVHRTGPNLVGKTIVVHTKRPDDRSVKGILHARHADSWALREALLILPGGREQALGGIQHIPTDAIAIAQEIEA